MNRPFCSDARYRSIASAPARAIGRLLPPGCGSKYSTEGNVVRGPASVGNAASRGGPEASAIATALLVVPKSRPTQRVFTPVAAPRADRASPHAAPAASTPALRPAAAAPARRQTPTDTPAP